MDLYADQDPESFNRWFPLDHEHLDGAPFKFYFTKLKSGSPEAIDLFMDPRSTLRGLNSLPALEGVDGATRITTTIVGHERTLRMRVMYVVVSYDTQDNSVAILSNKEVPTSG
jgi:hypothetical protein